MPLMHESSLRALGPSVLWTVASLPDNSDAPNGSESVSYRAARSLRILIVEDEILIALDLRSLVEESGHVVVGIVESADYATATATRQRPDVVLMDIALAGPRDGIDAALELRALELRARLDNPSLFVSAHPDLSLRRRAEAAKPVGFLTKPVDEHVLRRHLARL